MKAKSVLGHLGVCSALLLPISALAGGSQVAAEQKKAAAAAQTPDKSSESKGYASILEAAKSNGQFGTFLSAVEKAGLTDTLAGKGAYTVFAPTDEAFKRVPADQLNALLNDKAKLEQVLKSHILGQALSSEAMPRADVRTLNGNTLQIDMYRSHKMWVAGAEVVSPNMQAANGWLHGIDKVILPN